MKKIFYLFVILSAGLVSSCKKSSTKPATTLDKIKDSVYLYAQEDYLWNTSLPSFNAFNPTSFSNAEDLTALTNEVNAMSQYAINPVTGLPYEYYPPDPGQAKYSFIDNGTVSAELNGNRGDFGFNLEYNTVSDLRIKYVYAGSPAGLAGIKRGDQITSINGNTSLSYDAPGHGTGTSTNLNFVINAYSNSNTITMVVNKANGTSVTVNLAIANYQVNPVLKDTVYNTGNGHVVGYIVFNSFTSDTNADPVLDAAFNYFTAQGVTDLVVDLRYNGGGYVSTAEYLDNLIVPASASGSLMYNTYYNSNLVSGKDPLLKNQVRKNPNGSGDFNYAQIDFSVAAQAVNFAKKGSLNVNRVFFIMTGSTASASELTINNLRPKMDVQFVGKTSYGKPVGFFDIDINKYQMYIPEFSTKNSAGQGDYYTGMVPDSTGYPGVNDYDDPTKDFGDPTEVLLAHILSFVNTGTYAIQNPVIQSVQTTRARSFSSNEARKSELLLNGNKFNGMINNKVLKRKP